MNGQGKDEERADKGQCRESCLEDDERDEDQWVDGREGLEKGLRKLIRRSADPCSTVKVSLDE